MTTKSLLPWYRTSKINSLSGVGCQRDSGTGQMQEQTVEVKIDEEQMQIVAQVQKTLNLE
ncbi:hypothetical protein N5V81_13110 [Escherichia coli]|nr:hypothetical protein [Escherichia coli]